MKIVVKNKRVCFTYNLKYKLKYNLNFYLSCN